MGCSVTDVEGVPIHWTEEGSGAPLVLLHGLSDSHRTWTRVAPALARSRRVIAPDLPGHGLSGRPDASYSLAWYASVMSRWLDGMGLGEVDLVGHSFGGGVAQHMLLEARTRVRRLALVAPGGLGREVGLGIRLLSLSRLVERIGQPFMAPFTRVGLSMLRGVYDDDEIAWLSWANAMPGTARGLSRTVRDVVDWRGQKRHFLDRAHELAAWPPVALFWGEHDPVIPVAHAVRTASALEPITVRLWPCGHFPHREEPSAFARSLMAFLEAPSIASPALVRRPRPEPSRWRRFARVFGPTRRCMYRAFRRLFAALAPA